LEHAWNGLKTAASGAWDQMLGLGRTFTVDDKLAQVNEKIRRASENVGGMTGMNPQAAKQYMNGLLAEKSQFENERNRIELRASEKSIELQVQDAGLKASRDLKDFGERYASKKQQAAKEIKLYTDAIAARMAAGKGGVDSEQMQQEMIAKIREKYAVKAKRDPKDDPAKKKLDGDLKEQQDGIAAEGKLLQSREAALQYYVGLEFMTQTEALESKKRFIAESLAATELAFDKEVGFLKAREVGAARAVDKQDAQNKLADVAAKRAAAEVDANGKIGKSQQELEGIQRSFSLQNEEIARLDEKANVAARFQIDLLGQSTIEVLKQNEARKIELALEEKIRQEKKRDANYDASDATTEAAIQTLKAQALIVEGYEKQRTAIFGASEAMRKYGEDAGNSALQIENTMASAFKSAEDAFVQFTMTGKISFASLAQSIIAEIARIQAKKAIAGLVDLATGFFSGSAYTGGAISGADGSQFSATGADIQGRHARGGAVGTYGNFLVGEEGPEILRMGGTSGSIIPNDKLGGGAVTVINNFNGDGSSSSKSTGDGKDAARIGKLIGDKVREVILQEKRNGGLLTS
jgi:lambda family phage tail tape measure protein